MSINRGEEWRTQSITKQVVFYFTGKVILYIYKVTHNQLYSMTRLGVPQNINERSY